MKNIKLLCFLKGWLLSGKEFTFQYRRAFDPWVGKIPWRRKWQPTPVFLPGKFQGHRSLAHYSPWGHKELDMTEWLNNNNTLIHLVVQENRHKDPTQSSIRGTSLVVPWLRLHLPMKRLQVWSLVRELRFHLPCGQKQENKAEII